MQNLHSQSGMRSQCVHGPLRFTHSLPQAKHSRIEVHLFPHAPRYTTKMGVGMAEFMKYLRAGVERKLEEIKDEDRRLQEQHKATGTGRQSVAPSKKQAQLLLRIHTAYTRAKHVGGAQLVFPMLFGHMCYSTHRHWNVWIKTAVWRAQESWRRAYASQLPRPQQKASDREQLAIAHRGCMVFLPKNWRRRPSDNAILAPDGSVYDSDASALAAHYQTESIARTVTTADMQQLVDFTQNQNGDATTMEVNGAIVTTNQLDDYIHRGQHPLLKDLCLYVYSMYVHRVEKLDPSFRERHVCLPFDNDYKLAGGYVQALALQERVPKIDGFQMPPPRAHAAGAEQDIEMNAMFKSVLLRPIYRHRVDDVAQFDPVTHFFQLHECPGEPHPQHTWSPITAFSGAWHAHFRSVEALAKAASRKLLFRQELETIWETAEATQTLCELAELEPEVEPERQEHQRLTVQEYAAYITRGVANNLDAIAWARVSQKTRYAELAASLEQASVGQVSGEDESKRYPDGDQDTEPGTKETLRKVVHPVANLEDMGSALRVDKSTVAFVEELTSFLKGVEKICRGDRTAALPAESKMHWDKRRQLAAQLLRNTTRLRHQCKQDGFIHNCIKQQEDAFANRKLDVGPCEGEAEDDSEDENLDAPAVSDKMKPAELEPAWVQPASRSALPSEYFRQLLQNTPSKLQPTKEQLEFLALFVQLLDVVYREERNNVPWEERSQFILLLLGQGGCGKTFVVQYYMGRIVRYAFGTADAMRMVAYSNAQAANLASEVQPAFTMHRAAALTVQALTNDRMVPNQDQSARLENFWNPARVLVVEEFTMVPAEGYNMGLFRSAWGRKAKCNLDVSNYNQKGCYWGRTPIVVQLGDPLQKRPVKALSLLDTKEMLLNYLDAGRKVSVEAQHAIKVFQDFDFVYELTQTKRFVAGDVLPNILQSLRDANPDANRTLPRSFYTMLSKRAVASTHEKRLLEERFQCGHCIGSYHQTVIRYSYIRAPRDAREMRVPLYWCQASDDIKGLAHQAAQIRDKVVKGLRKCYNYNETAHLQSILPLHTGQRVRLTEKASPADDLVQEAEGTVIHVVCDPQESAKLQEQQLVLQYVPLGAWVLMDKCTSAPLSAQSRALFDADFDKSIWVHTHTGDPETHAPAATPARFSQRLVFVQAQQRTFKRSICNITWTITRRQIPLASALDRTVQSSQGLTFGKGVIADLGCLAGSDRNDHWLSVYVYWPPVSSRRVVTLHIHRPVTLPSLVHPCDR